MYIILAFFHPEHLCYRTPGFPPKPHRVQSSHTQSLTPVISEFSLWNATLRVSLTCHIYYIMNCRWKKIHTCSPDVSVTHSSKLFIYMTSFPLLLLRKCDNRHSNQWLGVFSISLVARDHSWCIDSKASRFWLTALWGYRSFLFTGNPLKNSEKSSVLFSDLDQNWVVGSLWLDFLTNNSELQSSTGICLQKNWDDFRGVQTSGTQSQEHESVWEEEEEKMTVAFFKTDQKSNICFVWVLSSFHRK